MSRSFTLLEYLTQDSPVITKAEPCSRQLPLTPSSTTNQKYPTPLEVVPWEDFTFESLQTILNGSFERHLQTQMDDLKDFSDIDGKYLELYCERDLSDLIGRWHQPVVQQALRRTSRDLIGQSVDMLSGTKAVLVFDDSKRFKADWAGTCDIERGDADSRPSNILPGDSKMSWNFTPMEEGIYENNWPLRQLLFYCIRSCSRYGYLITEKELVVMRVSRCKDAPPLERKVTESAFAFACHVARHAKMEYCSIPWTAPGRSDKITIPMALWALHILAANNGRLQVDPYLNFVQEQPIPRDAQSPIQRVPTAVAIAWGESTTQSFGEQEYVERLAPRDNVVMKPVDHDLGADGDGQATEVGSSDGDTVTQSFESRGSLHDLRQPRSSSNAPQSGSFSKSTENGPRRRSARAASQRRSDRNPSKVTKGWRRKG